MEHVVMTDLPPDILKIILARFEELIATGEMFYQPETEEIFSDGALKVQFRTIPSLSGKPLLVTSANSKQNSSPSPSTAQPAFNPFLPPSPRFHIFPIAPAPQSVPTHNLVLNRFPPLKPSLLITTATYKSQFDDLEPLDLEVTWNVMNSLGDNYWAFYNCGPESGMSQMHRHLQIFPEDETGHHRIKHSAIKCKEIAADLRDIDSGYLMFPDREDLPKKRHLFVIYTSLTLLAIHSNIQAITTQPYANYISYFQSPSRVSSTDVVDVYKQLIACMRERHPVEIPNQIDGVKSMPSHSYNVVLTKRWMLLVPRRSKGRNGINANAAGMAGSIWISDAKEKDAWKERGVREYLQSMGFEASNEP